jgi:hypothetical protein
MAAEEAAEVVWLSLDPVRCKLDFYPRVIAERIEAAYSSAAEQLVLGADFFNATVHFQNGTAFQTTPGQHFGRGGFKQPGYRTVKRVVKDGDTTTILGKRVHGEWRICEHEDEMERTFVGQVPDECLVTAGAGLSTAAPTLRAWRSQDLSMPADDGGVGSLIVWQWCRGVPEAGGNLNTLADDMWSPCASPVSRVQPCAHSRMRPCSDTWTTTTLGLRKASRTARATR